jgi:hypothetical protein
MSALQTNTRYALAERVLFQEVRGEGVLLNLSNETYFGLNPVGVQVWRCLVQGEALDRLMERLLDEYDVEPSVLARDIKSLLTQMLDQELITEVGSGS